MIVYSIIYDFDITFIRSSMVSLFHIFRKVLVFAYIMSLISDEVLIWPGAANYLVSVFHAVKNLQLLRVLRVKFSEM